MARVMDVVMMIGGERLRQEVRLSIFSRCTVSLQRRAVHAERKRSRYCMGVAPMRRMNTMRMRSAVPKPQS
jgi:hypothetical protein